MDMELSSGIAAFTAKEFGRAMQLLSPLAEAGEPEAQFRVAIMHQNGLGVVANPEKALQMMRAAAKADHALAQHGLAFMYLYDEQIERDVLEAVRWLELAVGHGLHGAMTVLAELYAKGDGVPRDTARARELYAQAGFDPDEFTLDTA